LALDLAEETLGMGAAPSRWSDLGVRFLSAAVMVPVALGCIWFGGAAFAVLVALIAAGMALEWLRLCQAPIGPRSVLMFAALPLAVGLAAIGQAGLALGLLALITFVGWIKRDATSHGRILPFGIPYLGVGAIALIWLRTEPADGRNLVLVLLVVIWATDIGAYVVGRAVGGPKLAALISPGKTVSGAIGGLLAAMVVGWAAAATLGAGDFAWAAALVAGGISCVGQAGDLFESLLKRHFNVKDSGTLIPGHGGLLDRLDAVLAAAPVAALLALLHGGGVIHW
jgi:phosphatidate cytidylyltransferase